MTEDYTCTADRVIRDDRLTSILKSYWREQFLWSLWIPISCCSRFVPCSLTP